MSESRFPPGWDQERVKRLIAYYDALSEDEQVAEDETAVAEQKGQTVRSPFLTSSCPQSVNSWRLRAKVDTQGGPMARKTSRIVRHPQAVLDIVEVAARSRPRVGAMYHVAVPGSGRMEFG
jgi:hypothetical protein